MLHRPLLRVSGCTAQWIQRGFNTGHQSLTSVTGSLPETSAVEKFQTPSTSVVNPVEHTTDHIGLWYTIPKDEFESLFSSKSIMRIMYRDLIETLQEPSIMIRKPALSMIGYIKQLDLTTMVPPKFLFYGEHGFGKTLSLLHVTHFLHKSDFVIIQAPWFKFWLNHPVMYPDEVLPSITVPERWDHVLHASEWLKFFKNQNLEKLSQPEYVLNEDYEFSSREKCSKGDTLLSVLDMGINRNRLAADCALTVTKELKRMATEGKCKVAVVMDGMNAAFTGTSRFTKELQPVKERRRYIKPAELTLCQAFLQFFDEEWSNGVIVGSVDSNASTAELRERITPRYLLDEEGFAKVDPFVAIPVPQYTDLECDSAYDYYASKQFIQREDALRPGARKFLRISTDKSPLHLIKTLWGL